MGNLGQVALGIIILLVVVGGLLYIFYSRTNAVEKTGYGSLIMLTIVALMIPVFWIAEGGNQAAAQNTQFQKSLVRAQALYAANCATSCFGIDAHNKVINPTYNGWTMDQFKPMTDDDVTRIISAGIYNPQAPIQPTSANSIPRSDEYGGALSSNDVNDLLNLVRSTDPTYLKKNNLPNVNGFATLPAYLQANAPTVYSNAVSFAKNGQFGTPIDDTAQKTVNLTILDHGQQGASCSSQVACFTPISIQVKVGTTIIWTNDSKVGHTITAIVGEQNLASPTAAPQIFDSGATDLVQTGKTFKYTVTEAAYNFNPDHKVIYFCRIHPDMLAELTIVK